MGDEANRYTVSARIKLAGLWVTLMLLYIYCDIYSFHRTGYIDEMVAGRIGPFDVSQWLLAVFGALMILPTLMIPVCLFFISKAVKWLNLTVAALYTLVNVGNLIGETWVYYYMFGFIGLAITILIMVEAAKLSQEETSYA